MSSFAELPNYVENAFVLVPVQPFVPENTVFGFYTFLPWVRTGIAAAVGDPQNGEIRATAEVHVPVQGGDVPQDVTQKLVVRGPGDVVSIRESQVIRRYPERNAVKVEDSFLAHVEFDRPDFPWIFSPHGPAGEQLSPWIALVVLRASKSQLVPGTGGLADQVHTTLSELQPLDDSWAWAHAQVVGKAAAADTASVDDRLTADYAALNLSRLVCPRRLAPDESYLVCVVPAYDAGVKAGLGAASPGTLDPAWKRLPDGSDAGQEVVLPVYTSWTFETTATAGDFKSLAERLVPLPAPWQIGRRVIDVAKPAGGLPPLAADAVGRLQTVRGPLFSPQLPDPRSRDPVEAAAAAAENATWPAEETEALRSVLNEPARLAGEQGQLPPAERPPVGPEIYGRNHAAVATVDAARDGDWLGEINLLPRNRIVAGLGTRVVQRDQEPLMQAAWQQVGDIEEANRQLRLAQFARFASDAIHQRHLATLGYSALLQVTRAVHSKLTPAAPITLHESVEQSSVPAAATSAAFRRLTRPNGPLERFVSGSSRDDVAALLGSEGRARDFQRPYRELDCVAGISEAAARAVDPTLAATVLKLGNVGPDVVVQALVEHGAKLEETPAIGDRLTPDAVQNSRPDPTFDLQQSAGNRVLDVMQRHFDARPPDSPAPAIKALSLLTSLENIGGDVRQRAVDLSQHVRTLSNVAPQLTIAPQPRLQQVIRRAQVASASVSVDALVPIARDLVSPTWPSTPVRPSLTVSSGPVLSELGPGLTLTSRVIGRLATLPAWLPPDWFDDHLVQPVMAAPVFTRPMYQALDAYDREWLIPGLARMPQPDLVTALVSNSDFVEAYLVGLSHEFGRELLWRGYPTDLRGTYFRRFWNDSADELIQDIHAFTRTTLGSHVAATLDGRIVLLVRGELIRHYPNALVLALRAGGTEPSGHPIFIDPATQTKAQAPILFHDHLSPDMVLVGFDLTVTEIKQDSWWFVICEHPTAPRFGLAESRVLALSRDTIAWGDLPTVFGANTLPLFLTTATQASIPDTSLDGGSALWGSDAAMTAHMALRDPVRAAFDARTLLGPMGALQ